MSRFRRLVDPTMAQVYRLTGEALRQHPTDSSADLKEAIRQLHVAHGFRYHNAQIVQAMDAVQPRRDPAPPIRMPSLVSSPASGPLSARETTEALTQIQQRLQVRIDPGHRF